ICFFLEGLGAKESMFSIQINDRKVVDALFNTIFKLDTQSSYKLYKVIDKAKKVSEAALDKMVGEIITSEDAKIILKKYLALTNFSELEDFLKENNLLEKTQEFINFHKKLEKLSFAKYLE